MTDCMKARANEWLERYVDGTLPDEEAGKFEEHYFSCPVCLSEVEALQSVREQLNRNPIPIRPVRRLFAWPVLTVSFGAVAAALVAGVITLHMIEHPSGPVQQNAVQAPNAAVKPAAPTPPPQIAESHVPADLAHLADLRMPEYHVSTLRGADEASAFDGAMKIYAAGNCADAVSQLARVDQQSPDFLAARFYLGTCQMHDGHLDAASRTLRQVAAAGDSPQQEAALYYLAQIALKQSDAAGARKNLNKVISLHGDLEHRARAELAQVPTGPTGR
ncbi:MAG TPA: tetratricopeptide repeat protein [Terracidiphilus sp.]|nr:tetratricopeptide repeat protein [Terracidiphilus sp.]